MQDVFILIFTPRQGPCQAVSSLFFVQRVGSHHWGSFNSDREKFDKIWIRHGILILHCYFHFFKITIKARYGPACCQLKLHILFMSSPFLDALLHLYNRVCPSVRQSVTHELKPCKHAVFDQNYYQYERERILCRVTGLVSGPPRLKVFWAALIAYQINHFTLMQLIIYSKAYCKGLGGY